MWLVSVATTIDVMAGVEEAVVDGIVETTVAMADGQEEAIVEVEIVDETKEDRPLTATIAIETMVVEIDTTIDVEGAVVKMTIDVTDLPSIAEVVDTGGETGPDLPWQVLVMVDAAVLDLVPLLLDTAMIAVVATIEIVGRDTMTAIATMTIPTGVVVVVVVVVVVDATTMSMWVEETLEVVVPRTCTAEVEMSVVLAVKKAIDAFGMNKMHLYETS
jgi:hypothetical protein